MKARKLLDYTQDNGPEGTGYSVRTPLIFQYTDIYIMGRRQRQSMTRPLIGQVEHSNRPVLKCFGRISGSWVERTDTQTSDFGDPLQKALKGKDTITRLQSQSEWHFSPFYVEPQGQMA